MISDAECKSCTTLSLREARALNQRYAANVGLMRFVRNMIPAAEVMRLLNETYDDRRVGRDPEKAMSELAVFNDLVRILSSLDEEVHEKCVATCLGRLVDGLRSGNVARNLTTAIGEECLREHASTSEHANTYLGLAARVHEHFESNGFGSQKRCRSCGCYG